MDQEKNFSDNGEFNPTLAEFSEPSESKTTVPDKIKVHNLIILDQSGSMASIYREALTGVNETLSAIRMSVVENPDQDNFVTLVSFNSFHYDVIYSNVPATAVEDITQEQYRPGGTTPLFDAMGRSLTELRFKVNPGDVVLVTIITDGYENSSREYSGAAIKALVEELRKKDWVFTYIGANQDVDKVADSIGIRNRMAFDATPEGTEVMFSKLCCDSKRFRSKVSKRRHDDSIDISDDFFA